MSVFGKITSTALFTTAALSLLLFGVWEDKVLLYGPLLLLSSLLLAAERLVKRNKNDGFQIPPGGIPLLLFWLYSVALTRFAVLPYEASVSTLCFGFYLGIYWAAASLFNRFESRRLFWLAMLAVLIAAALYSLVQHKVAPNLIFGMERYTKYWESGRLGGTYQCPNHIAHLFQMWIPLCFALLFMSRIGWFWKICAGYAAIVFMLLIYQTQSRAGILGVAAATGSFCALVILRKSRKAFLISLAAAPLLFILLTGALWAASPMFRDRMQPVAKFVDHISSGAAIETEFNDFRPQTWLDTIHMIQDRPWFGAGPGNYGLVYEKYRTRFAGLRIETVHPHNEYLELISEYGFIGAILIFWAVFEVVVRLVGFIRTTDRLYHALPAAAFLSALAGTAVHGFFDFELRNFPNAVMLALLGGCAVAPLMQSQPMSRPKFSRAVQIVFTCAALVIALWSVPVMSSSWIRACGDRAFLGARFQTSEKYFLIAKRLNTQNWLADWGLGRIYYYRRYHELDAKAKHEWALKEQAAYASAYRINPLKEEVLYGLGLSELFLGNRDRGLDLLRQAANYKRFNDFYWRKLGIELRKAGYYAEALSTFEYARKLNPSDRTVNRNIQWLKKAMAQSGSSQPAARSGQ